MRVGALLLAGGCLAFGQGADERYLGWSAQQVEEIGTNAYKHGRVGRLFDTRLLKTERAHNYKLAATWLTPDVIRASARMLQLRSRLSDQATRALVAEAEAIAGTVVMVEIDPREGSGVIPNDWEAFLEPQSREGSGVRGTLAPQLREVKALAGTLRRNYDYDRFWVIFPLTRDDGSPLFDRSEQGAVLVVRIHDKEGRVDWPVPDAVRTRMK